MSRPCRLLSSLSVCLWKRPIYQAFLTQRHSSTGGCTRCERLHTLQSKLVVYSSAMTVRQLAVVTGLEAPSVQRNAGSNSNLVHRRKAICDFFEPVNAEVHVVTA